MAGEARAGDRHKKTPMGYRPPNDTRGWLEDIAAREGRSQHSIVSEAVERARMISEADLAAFDREVTRCMMAIFTARNAGRDTTAEQAAFDAACAAYQHAISQWQPPAERESA